MKKISLTFSVITIILGIVSAALGLTDEYAGSTLAFLGGIIVFAGIAILACIYMYPAFGNSMAALIVSLVALGGGAGYAIEMAIRMTGAATATTPLMFIGIGLTLFSFILCPCVCMQGNKKSRGSVIGIAAAHESISINDISQKTGLSESVVGSIVYDAIGKGQLSGRMDGTTFKRSGPATGVSPDAKVLVICPYCGAKTEQGLSNCSKCGADI